jgi:hypothetical protein
MCFQNSIRRSALLLAACLVPQLAPAAIFTVGNHAGCTHPGLVQAIAAAEANGPDSDEIRLSMNHSDHLSGPYFIIDESVRITGGYQFCTSTVRTGRTQVNVGPRGAFRVASAPARTSDVSFRYLTFDVGGTPDVGGGIAVFGRAQVSIRDSAFQNLGAIHGGAIYLDGMDFAVPARVVLSDTVLRGNEAFYGGAVYCRGGGQVFVNGTTTLERNEALGDGGAASLDHCSWIQTGGNVVDNDARYHGGGIHATNASYLSFAWSVANGTATSPRISSNTASSAGGGIYASGAGTHVDATGLQLISNVVDLDGIGEARGAALYVADGATALLRRDSNCTGVAADCSRIGWNTARTLYDGWDTSVVQAFDGGRITLAQTMIRGNRTVAGGVPGGAIVDAGSSWNSRGESRATLRNTALIGNEGGFVVAGGRVRTDPSSGVVEAALVTFSGNFVRAVIGGPDSASTIDAVPVQLAAAVVDETEPLLLEPLTADSRFDCVLARTALPAIATRSLIADPVLNADGVPQAGSPARDYCSADGLPTGEGSITNLPRPLQDVNIPDRYGPMDLGAYELFPTLIIPPFGR